MGIKNSKGTVSVENFKGRVRLRWRYQSKRYSLSLYIFNKQNQLQARITALEIEQDMVNNKFDFTLVKYGGKEVLIKEESKTIVAYFEVWVSNYKQMDCDNHTNYNSTRGMLIKWGDIQEGNIQKKLSQLTNAAVTYNRRLTILKSFAKWLVKKGVWTANPLEDINPKKVKKAKLPKRAPFTVEEIHLILEAIKNDTYTPKCSSYKHSHYYPFIYFLFKTGVRNAEAIGLRVSSIVYQPPILILN
jgi:integrase